MSMLDHLDRHTARMESVARRALLTGSIAALAAVLAAAATFWLALHPLEITRIYAVDPWGHVSNGTSRLVVEPGEREMAAFAVAWLRDLREKTGVHAANVRRIQRAIDAASPPVREAVAAWLERIDHDGLAARTLEITSIEQSEPGRFHIAWVEQVFSLQQLIASEPYSAMLVIERKPSQAQSEDVRNIFGLQVSWLSWSPTLPGTGHAQETDNAS